MVFVDREHDIQVKRIDALRNQNGIARGIADLEKAIEKCSTEGALELFSTWRHSPFKPTFSNSYALLVKLEGVGDAIRDFATQLKNGRTGLEPHRNTIVWPHAFVAVLGGTLRRLTGSDPTRARLQSFVDACCTALPNLLHHIWAEQADAWASLTGLPAFLVKLKQKQSDEASTAASMI